MRCLRVAHLAHYGHERLLFSLLAEHSGLERETYISRVSERDIQDGFELLIHCRAWVGSQQHLEWLVNRLAPVPIAAISNAAVVRAVDGQGDDNDEDCGDWGQLAYRGPR